MIAFRTIDVELNSPFGFYFAHSAPPSIGLMLLRIRRRDVSGAPLRRPSAFRYVSVRPTHQVVAVSCSFTFFSPSFVIIVPVWVLISFRAADSPPEGKEKPIR